MENLNQVFQTVHGSPINGSVNCVKQYISDNGDITYELYANVKNKFETLRNISSGRVADEKLEKSEISLIDKALAEAAEYFNGKTAQIELFKAVS